MDRTRRAFLFALCAFLPVVAAAQPFDAVVSGQEVLGACFILPISFNTLEWVNPDRVDESTDVVSIASNDGQRVLALLSTLPYRIVEIRPDGTRTPFYTAASGRGFEIAVAANGTVYVRVTDVGFRLDRISASGTLEASYPLPSPPPGVFLNTLDVGPDSCTVFYAHGTTIRRIDGCTGAALPDFATVASLEDFDVLPDGQMLVAAGATVVLYSAAGTPVRTVATLSSYGFAAGFAAEQVTFRDGVVGIAVMNVCEPDGYLSRVSFTSGTELSRDPLSMNSASGLVLGAGAAGIPTLTETALALFAAAMAAAALFALRR